MKRYISAVLVPFLLLQLFGCYSHRIMATEELKHYKDKNDIKIWTDESEVLINRKANSDSLMNWEATDSSIIVKTQKSISLDEYNKVNRQDFEKLNTQSFEIKFNEIDSVEIDELNGVATGLLIVSGIAIIAIGVYLVSQLPPRDFTHLFGTPSK